MDKERSAIKMCIRDSFPSVKAESVGQAGCPLDADGGVGCLCIPDRQI